MTLLPYRDILRFEFEHPLNTEPLRIDAVIIKKDPGVVIGSPVGAIFREVNIVEYKSPGDYLSVEDFLKAGAYARLYSVLGRTDTRDMTLSFVVEAYPRKLMKHLQEVYGHTIREAWPGIYYTEGEIFPVQIIESKRLREEDGGIWLKNLRHGLQGNELQRIMEMSGKLPEGMSPRAYLDTVLRANTRGLEEMAAMADTYEEVLERLGLTAKWEAKGLEKGLEKGREKGREEGREKGREEGREKGREEDVKRLQKYGMEPAQIAEALELSPDTVSRYLNA